jgi:hypothetical protein
MLDPHWLRSVLEQEGLGEWRVCVAPGPCTAQCRYSTREILIPPGSAEGTFLLEVAHIKHGQQHDHGARWRAVVARLVTTHTVPVCTGALGLGGA